MQRRLLLAWLRYPVWLALATPALVQLVLLVGAIAGRLTYPYDLEWMEGGLLHHAYRIDSGQGIYNEPSIEFIPYLYTPLYPGLLALLGRIFGLDYALGRVISVVALAAIAALALVALGSGQRRREGDGRPVGIAAAVAALGLFAATYPFVDAWFDLVRADTMALAMVTWGVYLASRVGVGVRWRGDARAAGAAAILALAFFAKQTAVLYVAWGGFVTIAWQMPALRGRWLDGRIWGLIARRGVVYTTVAAAIGLGGTALFQHTTGGWFWTYVFEIHQAHDFNMDRFWRSFPNILWKFPTMTVVAAIGPLAALLATAIRSRQEPRRRRARTTSRWVAPHETSAAFLWAPTFALSTVVGAIGWGTEFAHFNAYMPAFLHGGLAAGAAVPALWWLAHRAPWRLPFPRMRVVVPAVVGAAALGALAVPAWNARWRPSAFVPHPNDVEAGDALIEQLHALPGQSWAPSHPWYLRLAGKEMHAHKMGIKDVTARKPRPIRGFDAAVREQRFDSLLLDERDLHLDWPAFRTFYRPDLLIPSAKRPRAFSGARTRPEAIWVPATPTRPPAGVQILADFEGPGFGEGWIPSGGAWGQRPVDRERSGQGLVAGFGGRNFVTSIHGGDAATGTLRSPTFRLDGSRVTVRMAGGNDARQLRVELWVDQRVAAIAAVTGPPDEQFRLVEIDVRPHRGQEAHLVLVDQATGSWGHISVDEIWLWP